MKNLFNRFKVTKSISLIYDTYMQGNYIQYRTVQIPADAVIHAERVTKAGVNLLSFNAKEFGVDELVQMPAANAKYLFPNV